MHVALARSVAVQPALEASTKGPALAACGVCWRPGNSPSLTPRAGHTTAHVPSPNAVATLD